MNDLGGLVALLVEQSVLEASAADQLIANGVSAEVRSPMFEEWGVIDDADEPAMWWAQSLLGGQWWFNFWLDTIAETQIDDQLIDVIAPVMAKLGVDLTHDWHGGDRRPDTEDGLRVWMNGELCDFGRPPELSCVQPLVVANLLLARAGADRRFYFAGRQWLEGSFVPEDIRVVLLPTVAAAALAQSEFIIDEAKPSLVDDVL